MTARRRRCVSPRCTARTSRSGYQPCFSTRHSVLSCPHVCYPQPARLRNRNCCSSFEPGSSDDHSLFLEILPDFHLFYQHKTRRLCVLVLPQLTLPSLASSALPIPLFSHSLTRSSDTAYRRKKMMQKVLFVALAVVATAAAKKEGMPKHLLLSACTRTPTCSRPRVRRGLRLVCPCRRSRGGEEHGQASHDPAAQELVRHVQAAQRQVRCKR